MKRRKGSISMDLRGWDKVLRYKRLGNRDLLAYYSVYLIMSQKGQSLVVHCVLMPKLPKNVQNCLGGTELLFKLDSKEPEVERLTLKGVP